MLPHQLETGSEALITQSLSDVDAISNTYIQHCVIHTGRDGFLIQAVSNGHKNEGFYLTWVWQDGMIAHPTTFQQSSTQCPMLCPKFNRRKLVILNVVHIRSVFLLVYIKY